MVDIKKFGKIDLYQLIGVGSDATEKEIRKSYRKKALIVHPDKNSDPKASELFHQLQDALKILTDVSVRKAYDQMLKAKKETEIRNRRLDDRRQKLKSDLEARERDAAASKKVSSCDNKTSEEIFQMEFERVMKENSKIVEEENELIAQTIDTERKSTTAGCSSSWDSSKYRIKIKWKALKDDVANGGYNKENLTKFLIKYGDIVAIVISSKKNGSALVEFKDQNAAEMAIDYEKGMLNNPLKLEWIELPPGSFKKRTGPTIKESDYESLVLRQLRQAEERKRLIEQIIKDDDEK